MFLDEMDTTDLIAFSEVAIADKFPPIEAPIAPILLESTSFLFCK